MIRSRARMVRATAGALIALIAMVALTDVGAGESIGLDGARVIVKFKAGSSLLAGRAVSEKAAIANRAALLGQKVGVALTAGAAVAHDTQVVLAEGLTSEALAQWLASEPDVEYAVPDERRQVFVAPNDPLYGPGVPGNGPAVGQWYLRAPSGEVQSSIDIEPAWAVTTGSPNVVVGVLDTGVRFDHPDLGAHLLPGYDMISDANTANDGDGRDADASDPGDWVTQTEITQRSSPFYQCAPAGHDSSWHGTQTSGLIAALTDNGIGMASVGRNVRVLPVRVIGKCGGFDSDIAAGMRWAAGLAVPGVPLNPTPAKILNMSLGGAGSCNAVYRQAVADVTATGAVIVAAAGNGAGHAVSTPGNCGGVIAVGALRHVGTKVGFSNVGPEILLSAPGGNCINITPGSACLYPILTTSNGGITTPGSASYSDSFRPSLGTSFSTPLVSGTVALMLSAQPSLTPAAVRTILTATARPFPTTGADPSSGVVGQCTAPQFDATGAPVDQAECYCTTSTCGAGMLDAGAALLATGARAVPQFEVEGLWWNAPAGSESGWGLNLAQQGDVIFATWFTYDLSGKPWWLSMTATKTGPNAYAGTLLESHGPSFSAVPFDPAFVTARAVGQASLTFRDANTATFAYTVNGASQTKTITREVFGTEPTCTFGALADLSLATNFQDLWWAAPAGSESGWGLNLIQQSNVIFATWYTYGSDGNPTWLSLRAASNAVGAYSGSLNRLSGPAFNAVPFNPSDVQLASAGQATLTFTDGNHGTFAYTVDGIGGSKAITRDVFRAPGTVCR